MSARARIDSKGRVFLPKEFREALGVKEGDELVIMLKNGKIIIERAEDPFKILGEVLGELSFSRELRKTAEEEGLRAVKEG
ncbi:MAG: AbrB/MazE/SpoVT family DNA-binding domain-containing protein [Candidatus Nezhaarchaeales archaeon]